MSNELPPFGKHVRELREFLGWKQTDLVGKSGLSPAAISQIEAGVREPSLNSIVAISRALGCTTDRLIFGPGEQVSVEETR